MKHMLILLLLFWDNVEFTLTHGECLQLPSVDRAFVPDEYKKVQYQIGDVIYFSCDPGYTTGFNTTYICTENGWRAAHYGQCVEKGTFTLPLGCTRPPPLKNGSVLNNSSYFYANGDKVKYQCDHLYNLEGRPYKTCSNGQWIGDLQCLKFSCELPAPNPNVRILGVDGGRVAAGNRVTVQCVRSEQVECLPSGTWSSTFPTCRVGGCTLQGFKQSVLYHESFDLSGLTESYDSGDNVRVPCKVGFIGFIRLICSDGQWFSTGDKCTISCPPLTVSHRVLVNGDPYQSTSGSVLQFSCSSRGDKLIGSTRIECDENGNWDSVPPTCQEISCKKPQLANFQVEGDKMVYKKDEFLRYSCDRGYKKVDGRPSLCQKVGQSAQWTPTPQCEAASLPQD